VVTHDLIETIMPTLKSLTSNEADFVRLVLERLSDLFEELTRFAATEVQEAMTEEQEELYRLTSTLKKREIELLRSKREETSTELRQVR